MMFGSLLSMQAHRPGSVDSGPGAPTPAQCMEAMVKRARSMEDFPVVFIISQFVCPANGALLLTEYLSIAR